jgi:NADH-ubiquinone oxidoreductase chain 2
MMIFLSLLIYIVAMALPSFNKQISPILLNRISTIILIYAGALSFNAFYIQSIGSGIGIYSGLFNVTLFSQFFDIFILLIASLILIPRPTNFFLTTLSNLKSSITKNVIKDRILTSNKMVYNSNYNNNNNNSVNRYLPSVALGGQYSLIILFSILGSLLLVSSGDLVSIYLSIELQSFGLYILATLFRDSKLATSAGLKYFLLGGLSSCLILLGAGLVYTYTGLTNLESIYALVSGSYDNSITLLFEVGITLGFILIMVGFLFKIAAAPLHNWAPDVYDDSPTIVTIWLTIMPKIAILILLSELFVGGIGRICMSAFNLNSLLPGFITGVGEGVMLQGSSLITAGDMLTNLLLITSLLSFLVGTILGLVQSRIKRLLAYSTISHIGFLLLALAINTEQSIESFIFYIIQYSLTNLNTFFIILAFGLLINYSGIKPLSFLRSLDLDSKHNNYIGRGSSLIADKDIRFIYELKGQFMSNPLLALSLAICLFSMAGIPPLLGFFSKQMVLYAAIQSGYYFMAIVAIIVSVISASYYLKIVRVLFSESDDSESSTQSEGGVNKLPLINDTSKNIEVSNINVQGRSLDINNISPDMFTYNFDGGILYLSDSQHSSSIKTNESTKVLVVNGEHTLTNLHSLLISILTLSILFFIVKPSLLLNSTQLLSLSLYNF